MEERDGDAYVNFGACHADMNRAFGRTEDDKRGNGLRVQVVYFHSASVESCFTTYSVGPAASHQVIYIYV